MASRSFLQSEFRYVDESWRVLRAFDKARVNRLMRAGAIQRSEHRKSIRFRRRQQSAPGQPPYAHTRGGIGIKTILFGYDRQTQSVVSGMVGLPGSDVPEALEFGGYVWVKRRHGRGRHRVRIRKRPSNFPALKRSAARVPSVFRGMI